MTEFTRDIKPVNYKSAPQLAAPSGSLGTDLVNAAATGFELYSQHKNKSREAELEKMVGDLTSFETELSQNGLSKRERLSKVDARVREMGLGASQEAHLRKTLAQRRGSYVQRDMISEVDKEAAKKEQQLESEFNAALSNAPQLFSSYKRNEDGGYSREDKISIVSDFEDLRVREFQRAKETEKYQQQLAQGGVDALEGAATASRVISSSIRDVFATTSAGFVQTLSNLDLKDPQNIKLAEEILKNGRNTFRVAKNSIESQYNSLYDSQTDPKVRELLEQNRDASMKEMDNILTTLESTDISKVDSLVQDIKLIENGLKLKGLENYPMMSMIREIAPEASKYFIQAMVVKYGDIEGRAVDELANGLMGMDASVATQQFGKKMAEYMDTGDTTKASDLVLSTFYDFARDTITNMPARDLSSGEIDKISGGLLGIMQEAAATDNPKQIKEATVLLNSPNFKDFFEQLPENRQAPMGRFISSFNQDVLIDKTDGYFTKLSSWNDSVSNITYDATLGKFISEGVKEEKLPTGGLGFNVTKQGTVQKDIDKANEALEMIRTNAQYDPVTQNAKELIDTMISEKLPLGITIKGKLDIFTAKESAQQVKPEESKIRSNKDILLSLRNALDNMTEGTLVNSPEFKKLLDGLDEGGVETGSAKLTQIDYSEYEDGIYEDEDGEKVRIRKGKVVQ